MRSKTRWLALASVGALSLAALKAEAQRCQHNTQVGCVRAGATCSPVTKGGGATGRCRTSPGLPPGERECECVGTPIPSPPPFDPRCSDPSAVGKFSCRIDRPEVGAAEKSYPVVFVAKDVVEVSADGCVQTGGRGKTWKRYVNPSGPNSARLYHGRVRIPTATKGWERGPVRINSVVGQLWTVTGKDAAGQDVPPSQLVLSLGYEDDDYSDNGYHDHDDGTDDQCKSESGNYGGPAHVTITISRGVPADPPYSRFNFDVVSTERDPNGLPFNPIWSWQARNAGQTPNTKLCHNFSVRGSTGPIPDMYMKPSFADCTDQADATTVDEPSGWPNEPICKFWTGPYIGDSFAGHVNWFPVTMRGRTDWGDHAEGLGDDDYTFEFHSEADPAQPNPLSVNGRPGLHAEFDSDETIDHFTSDAWKELHEAVDNDEAQAKRLFDGDTIITGMFGLDSEHGMKAELHPVYAMAIRRYAVGNEPSDEVWLMFVRNLGNEGFCSSKIWDARFEDYTFQLPWRPGMASVRVDVAKTRFDGTPGTTTPVVRVLPPGPAPADKGAVFVTFHLGPPQYSSQVLGTGASRPFVNGALHLVWKPSVAQPAPTPRPSAGAGAREEADDAEGAIAAAIRKLPPAQRDRVRKARDLPGTKPARVHKLGPVAPATIITDATTIARTTTPRAVKAGPATRKKAQDTAMMKKLCALTGNAPAGLPPEACPGATPRPQP